MFMPKSLSMSRLVVVAFVVMGLSFQAQAESKMKVFLNSCALGIGVGALIGVASMAISEDPGSKLNQVARGASYGLYAGIGLGAYLVNVNKSDSESVSKYETVPLLIAPTVNKGQIDGAQVLVSVSRF